MLVFKSTPLFFSPNVGKIVIWTILFHTFSASGSKIALNRLFKALITWSLTGFKFYIILCWVSYSEHLIKYVSAQNAYTNDKSLVVGLNNCSKCSWSKVKCLQMFHWCGLGHFLQIWKLFSLSDLRSWSLKVDFYSSNDVDQISHSSIRKHCI